MKKTLTLLLALTIVFALACPVFADDDVENLLLENAKWTKGLAESITTDGDGVVTATGIKNAWSAPSIDILPSIKEALGTDDEIELTISFDARATFTAGNEGSASTGRVLIRGTNGISGLNGADNAESWMEAYDESLDGEDPLFRNSSGNILCYLGGNVDLVDDEWSNYTVTLFLYSSQIDNASVIEWKLTLDAMTEPEKIESLQFRNLILTTDEIEPSVEITDGGETGDDETGDGEATDTTDDKKPETDANPETEVKPEATQKPTVATPDLTATEAPSENGTLTSFNATAVLITAISASTVIIVACIAAIVLVKKKTSK